uniref:NAD dependent epimerase/dehydratase family protein (GalE, GALE) n=1 Tax=uncultured marine thaumarchaeote KM3_74_H09 TaxID=1456276 RepID=A0A075HQX2_9ARCH|nr:NAD dependent epimerase/dehydratase family protein (galE, GALE) [uncultured marine thaumarchaeote KM3_74_H09]
MVTGGAGFIGKHLVAKLLHDQHEIIIFDNFSSSSKNDITHLLEDGADLVTGDILDYDLLLKSMSNHDFVIHLAAQTSVSQSIADPKTTADIIVDGTVNVLKSCVKANVKNIIFSSSAAVYGNSLDALISEKSHLNPLSSYGASKLVAEYNLQTFSKLFSLNSISLRLFNVYGNGQSSEAGVVRKFLKNISKDVPLEIFGDGMQTRDFVHISDVIEAFYCAIRNIEAKRGEIYNIGSGSATSINELASLLISSKEKDLQVIHKPALEGEIKDSKADISLAKNDIGYSPQIPLSDGLASLV